MVDPAPPAAPPRFRQRFTATPADIDELGHVNNAVWVRWIQDLSVAHWHAVAPLEQQAAYVWVVTRHEIDYRASLGPGESVTGETWVPDPPRGARFDRHFRFTDDAGRLTVEGRTTWAALDRASGRLVRIRADMAAPFLAAP